jgi:hypothetical protein
LKLSQDNPNPPGADPHDGPAGIDPPADGAPADVAAQLVVHGLLEYLRINDAVAQERRVARVMEEIAGERVAGRVFPRPSSRPSPRVVRWAMAAAVLLAVGVWAYFVGIPSERAQAEVQRAVAALRAAGDRRYEVRLQAWDQEHGSTKLGAVVDTRSPGITLVRHWPPRRENGLIVGHDAKGEWAIRPEDGTIERERARQYWPPWSVDGESLTVDSLDTLLEQLPKKYTLEQGAREPLAGGVKLFDRVSATRGDHTGMIPERVELWIDPETRLAERVEFRWTTKHEVRGAPPGRNDGDHVDHAPPDRDGHPDGPDQGPDRGGPDRAGPDQGPDRGPGHRPPPRKDGGPQGRGPQPMRLIVFQRVDAPVFAPDWFTPEGHVSK